MVLAKWPSSLTKISPGVIGKCLPHAMSLSHCWRLRRPRRATSPSQAGGRPSALGALATPSLVVPEPCGLPRPHRHHHPRPQPSIDEAYQALGGPIDRAPVHDPPAVVVHLTDHP